MGGATIPATHGHYHKLEDIKIIKTFFPALQSTDGEHRYTQLTLGLWIHVESVNWMSNLAQNEQVILTTELWPVPSKRLYLK